MITHHTQRLEQATGELFGDLWGPYDEKLFEESVDLFRRRLVLAGIDESSLRDKRCLDAGCGGGRNSIAMARLGAESVWGIDLGEKGLADARRRSAGMTNVQFMHGSILEIPFDDESFDLVWCAGVLMITADEERALTELTRVTRKGGVLYLLVYATEGMRWPLIELLRPLAAAIGKEAFERAIARAGEPPNKRRTFLDDLFCPKLDFYHWERLHRMLKGRGFSPIRRLGVECRLDHEADLASYRRDLESLLSIVRAGAESPGESADAFASALGAVTATIRGVRWFEEAVDRGVMTAEQAMSLVIGQGHHRVVATRSV